ncbi:hypothetical protein HDK64DRAFT_299548 [Phyllosticta capitalensis]
MAKPLVVGLVAALLLVGCGGGCQPVEGVVTGAVQRERKKILQGLIPRDYSATRHHYSPKRGEDWSGQGCGELLVSGHYWSGVSVEKMEEMEGSLEHAWGKKQTSPPVPSTTKVSMFATDDPHGGIGSVPRRAHGGPLFAPEQTLLLLVSFGGSQHRAAIYDFESMARVGVYSSPMRSTGPARRARLESAAVARGYDERGGSR